jgi:uncharacterized coiled-coil protein SlyX
MGASHTRGVARYFGSNSQLQQRRIAMEVKLANRLTMIKATSTYMAENLAVWNTMAPLQAAMTELDAKLVAISAAAVEHETPNGATMDKADARDALEDVTFLGCEALSVIAHDAGDNDLAALTRVTRSTLARMTEDELSNRATAVLTQTNTHKTELAPMHVTQENIDEFSEALTEFNAAKARPRTAISARAALTESLPKLIRDEIGILRNKVDPMVSQFSRSHPEFVAGYDHARTIVDRAATHKTQAASTTTTPNP